MKDIMLNYYKHIALPACLALVFGMPLAAQAADDSSSTNKTQNESDQAPGQASSGAGLDDGTKEKFVNAYVEIKDIQSKYTRKLENINDKQKAQELQKQAQAEMVKVVKNNDMTVHEYNEVVSAISSDPELRMEIEKMAQAQSE